MTLAGDPHLLQGILIKRRSIYLSLSCRGPALHKTTWNIIKNCFYFAHCCTNFHSNQPKLVCRWWITFLPLLLLSSHCSCWGLKNNNNPKSLVYVELRRKLKHMNETRARDATVWWKPLGRSFMRALVQKPEENERAEIWAPETLGRYWLQTAVKSQFGKQRGRKRSQGVVFIRWQKWDVQRNTFL